MTDIEGISGIYTNEQVSEGGSRFREGREFMTAEINVCADACKEAGAEKVYVRDAHGGSFTVLWDKLSPSVDYLVSGYTGAERYPGISDCDGLILLGYHAMAGTPGGILEHTMNSAGVQNYWLNGLRIGETAIDAAIAGDRGVPVIMVSGDDKLEAEVSEILPWAVTAVVKRGITWRGGILLPPGKARAIIREKTLEAVRNIGRMKPYVVEKPVKLRVEQVERGRLPDAYAKPYMEIIDGRTYEVTAASAEEALFRL